MKVPTELKRIIQKNAYGDPVGTRYSPINGGLPWRKELPAQLTKEAAWQAACEWCAAYEQRDRLGNMATPLGVIQSNNGWRGIVNYYHSNT